MNKLLCTVAVLLLASCASRQAEITGCWVQPVPGQPGAMQGIRLLPGGGAESVNMNTLVYTEWSRNGNVLTLRGKSIGNKNSSVFTTQAVITSLTDGKLELEAGGQKDAYTRVKP